MRKKGKGERVRIRVRVSRGGRGRINERGSGRPKLNIHEGRKGRWFGHRAGKIMNLLYMHAGIICGHEKGHGGREAGRESECRREVTCVRACMCV